MKSKRNFKKLVWMINRLIKEQNLKMKIKKRQEYLGDLYGSRNPKIQSLELYKNNPR